MIPHHKRNPARTAELFRAAAAAPYGVRHVKLCYVSPLGGAVRDALSSFRPTQWAAVAWMRNGCCLETRVSAARVAGQSTLNNSGSLGGRRYVSHLPRPMFHSKTPCCCFASERVQEAEQFRRAGWRKLRVRLGTAMLGRFTRPELAGSGTLPLDSTLGISVSVVADSASLPDVLCGAVSLRSPVAALSTASPSDVAF